jgi:hypothetical protein
MEVVMKKWMQIAFLVLLAFFVALAGISCQQSGASKSAELRGTIHKNDAGGLYVISGGKRYQIESQQDLSSMDGKMVTLQGTISEEDGRRTITVTGVDE